MPALDLADAWRTDPLGYLTHLDPRHYLAPRHLRYLAPRIASELRRGNARIWLSLPPRHGKSELCSYGTPLWRHDRWPARRVGLASYAASLSTSFSRRVRDTIVARPDAFRVRVSASKGLEHEWETGVGSPPGGMIAVGVGGGLTGRGLDDAILDDPYKDPEEAWSPTYRQKVEEWFHAVFMARLEPGANVLGVMTRWHHEDIAGKCLRRDTPGGDVWTEIRIPAIAESGDPLGRAPGEALWPERYPLAVLEQKRASMPPRIWSALYQGNPLPEEGAMFRRSWFGVLRARPALIAGIVRRWDLAASKTKAGRTRSSRRDFAAGCLMIRTREDRYVIAHMERIRGTAQTVEAAIVACAMQDGQGVPITIEKEPGSAGEFFESYLTRQLAGWAVTFIPSTGDKATRARPLASQAEAGNVSIVEGSWNGAFLDETEVFPDGEYDDQTDSASGAFSDLCGGRVWPWQSAPSGDTFRGEDDDPMREPVSRRRDAVHVPETPFQREMRSAGMGGATFDVRGTEWL